MEFGPVPLAEAEGAIAAHSPVLREVKARAEEQGGETESEYEQ